jgi:hypothetical protein
MKRIRRVFVVGLLVAFAAMLAVAPVLAAPGDGAVVTTRVFPLQQEINLGWALLEVDQIATTRTVATPTGLTNVTVKVDQFLRVTEYATGLSQTINATRMQMSQSVEDVVRLLNERMSRTLIDIDGTTVTTMTHFLEVDGRVVIDSVTVHD